MTLTDQELHDLAASERATRVEDVLRRAVRLTAERASARERERCARVCERYAAQAASAAGHQAALNCAASIRDGP